MLSLYWLLMEASGQIRTLASVPREKSWVERFGDFRIILIIIIIIIIIIIFINCNWVVTRWQ